MNRKSLGIACLFIAFGFLGLNNAYAQPLNGNYTINQGAAASSTNYTTFQSFFNALSTNGVNGAVNVTVSNGPYTEQVDANAISGVSATNTITIDGNSQVLQFNATSSSARHTFRFNGADYVTLKNLTIKAQGTTYSWGVHFMNASDYDLLQNCIVEISNNTSTTAANNIGINICNSTSSYQSSSNAANYTVIRGCTVKGNGGTVGPYTGIAVSPQSQNVNSYVRLENNTVLDFYVYGIYMYYASGVTVKGNDISRPNRTNSSTCYGIEMYYYSYNDTLIGNRIHNTYTNYSTYTGTFYGIRAYYQYSGNSNSVVANNAIYNIEHNGVFYGIYSYYSQAITFAHNTVSQDYSGTYSSTTYGMYMYNGYQNLGSTYVNNIVNITRPGSGTRIGYYLYAGGVINNNNVYLANGTNYYAYNAYNGNYWSTLSDFQSGTVSWPGSSPFDMNGSSADPKFANVSTGNLSPTIVQLDNTGTAVSNVLTDINGVAWGTDRDPGAYKFDINANVSKLTLTGASSCQEQKENIKMWVKNASPYPQSAFTIQYRVNGGAPVEDVFSGTLNAGDSALFSFPNPYTYSSAGVYNFDGRIKGKTFSTPFIVTVNAAPLGSSIVKGSTYNGTFNGGSAGDPDVVANPDTLVYELTAPSGYTNAEYGTKWYISSLQAFTVGGANIPSGDTARFAANSSQNLKLRFKPSSSLTDSTVRFTFRVYSTTTSCYAPNITRDIKVAPRPVAGFTLSDVCDGVETFFSSNSSISSGTMNYEWDFGDGSKSNLVEKYKTYSTYGTYNVTLKVTSNYGYTNSISKTINVFRRPDAGFSVVNQCSGGATPFTDKTVVYSGPLSYKWDFGDGSAAATAANPTHQYTNFGLYAVKLSVTDAKGCISEITKPVTYSASPKAVFSTPALTCSQDNLTFTNSSIPAGNTGYTWKFGDGSQSTAVSPSHTYSTPGTYSVTVIARNDYNCADSMVKTVTILDGPIPGFTVSGQCMGEAVNITNTTTAPTGSTLTYNWKVNGNTSTNQDVTTTFTSKGDFEVVLQVKASNGCEAEKKTTLTITEKPVVAFVLPATACTGVDVPITNGTLKGSSTISYDWDLGNGNSTAKDPVANYTTAGTYNVKLTASTGVGCKSSETKAILVTETPVSDFTAVTGKTGDGGVQFTPASPNGNGEYTWIYGDGGAGSSKTQHAYKFLSTGFYQVTLEVVENGCKSKTTKDVNIYATGTKELAEGRMSVYPNPSNGVFNIQLADVNNISAIKVVSLLGAEVLNLPVNNMNNTYSFDLGREKAGVYFVQLVTADGVYTSKITLNK